MSRIEKLAQGLLRPMNPYVSSILGLLTLCWGLFVINPLFDAFGSAKVFDQTLRLAPEWVWGLWATCVGLGILLSIFFTHARALSIALGGAVWHWSTIAIMLWWGDWQNTAGLTYTFISLYAITAYLNIRVNYVKQGIKHI